jgi:hypothetical protein
MNFPHAVENVLNQIKLSENACSIWFIGSRANGNYRVNSDWDFICFMSESVTERIAMSETVDIIQVDCLGEYLLEGQTLDLKGMFSSWQWHDLKNGKATYVSRITPNVPFGQAYDHSDTKLITNNAFRIWVKNI